MPRVILVQNMALCVEWRCRRVREEGYEIYGSFSVLSGYVEGGAAYVDDVAVDLLECRHVQPALAELLRLDSLDGGQHLCCCVVVAIFLTYCDASMCNPSDILK